MIKKKVLNNISWLVLDKLATLLLGLIVIVKVANYYGPADYGLYQYAISINLILGIVVLFVDGRVVKKLYPEKNEGLVIYNTTIAKVILSFISLVLGLLIVIAIDKDLSFNSIFNNNFVFKYFYISFEWEFINFSLKYKSFFYEFNYELTK